MLYYIYDYSGNVIGFNYQNNNYYYEKNIQNDVIGIMDSNYNIIVNYEYDSYGKLLSIKDNNGNTIIDTTNIGIINLNRMSRGSAPLDIDGIPMHLHHPYGRQGNNFYIFTPMTQTEHIEWHNINGWRFK